MKKIIFSAITVALLATSCSKSSGPTSEEPAKTEPTVLLTKIANVTQGSSDNGKVLAAFTYNGKQLSSATLSNGSENHYFTYNSAGQLTGTNITKVGSGALQYTKSTVTYSGANLNKISFTKSDNSLWEHTLTYDATKLTHWRVPYTTTTVDIDFNYDGSGNNIKQVTTETTVGRPNPTVYNDTYASFDGKKNLTSALPFWIYFRVYLQEEGIGFIPGAGNPASLNTGSSNQSYVYTYNAQGYPTRVTRISGGNERAYAYEYTEVK